MLEKSWRALAVALGLAVLVLAVYGQARTFEFLSYDDPAYVSENPAIAGGLSWKGVRWALTSFGYQGNSDPLTWISHMLDVELFGLDAGRHHLTSVFLHLLNTLLLWRVLSLYTGAFWRGAAAAGLFAVHPQHVEAVAWIASRKDVLSTLFLLLCLAAWRRHLARPHGARYAAALGLFFLGLMAKPMLVSLPLILVLLDFWPLGRLARPRNRSLLTEKIPFFLLAGADAVVTALAQAQGNALLSLEQVPAGARAANALVSLGLYLVKTFKPTGLAVFYPHPAGAIPLWELAAAALAVALLTAAVLRSWRRLPFLATGWLWYLVSLIPVLGLVQIGWFARADRFTYVPLIGIYVAFVWAATALAWRLARQKAPPLLAAAAVASLTPLALAARAQTALWKDSATLFGHALAVTRDNWVAEYHLAGALMRQGRRAEALPHYQRALQLRGGASSAADVHAEAMAALEAGGGLPAVPAAARSLLSEGDRLARDGRPDAAVDAYRRTLALAPDWTDALNNMGAALFHLGRLGEAEETYRRVLALEPASALGHVNLAVVLDRSGKTGEAITHLEEALRLSPGDAAVRARLESLRRRASQSGN